MAASRAAKDFKLWQVYVPSNAEGGHDFATEKEVYADEDSGADSDEEEGPRRTVDIRLLEGLLLEIYD